MPEFEIFPIQQKGQSQGEKKFNGYDRKGQDKGIFHGNEKFRVVKRIQVIFQIYPFPESELQKKFMETNKKRIPQRNDDNHGQHHDCGKHHAVFKLEKAGKRRLLDH